MNTTNTPTGPRAITGDEVAELIIARVREIAEYWGSLPDTSKMKAAEGTAFSILAMLDGAGMGLPAFDLVPRPHESDKEYSIDNGENYFEAVPIAVTLHELFSRAGRIANAPFQTSSHQDG